MAFGALPLSSLSQIHDDNIIKKLAVIHANIRQFEFVDRVWGDEGARVGAVGVAVILF